MITQSGWTSFCFLFCFIAVFFFLDSFLFYILYVCKNRKPQPKKKRGFSINIGGNDNSRKLYGVSSENGKLFLEIFLCNYTLLRNII